MILPLFNNFDYRPKEGLVGDYYILHSENKYSVYIFPKDGLLNKDFLNKNFKQILFIK